MRNVLRIAIVIFYVLFLSTSLCSGITVFMSDDFSQTQGVGQDNLAPNSEVTLEIDNGNNNSVDYQMIIFTDAKGVAYFPSQGLFSVTQGDLVKVYDDGTVRTHIVDFLKITDVDLLNDTFFGLSESGTEVIVVILDGPTVSVVTAPDNSWSVDLSNEYDLRRCTPGFIQTVDENGDHTQINLPPSSLYGCPGLTLFMNADFTQTESVAGYNWVPGSAITLEIDNGNDNSVDYQKILISDSNGQFWLPANGDFSVQENDMITMYDDQSEQTIKTHIVDFLKITDIDTSADTLNGQAREGKEMSAMVFDPEFPAGPTLQAITDDNGVWIADFSSEIDIVSGSAGFVYIQDNDNDKTQINWQAQENIVQMMIDIKPGSDPNCFNVNGHGVIPVAILGSAVFEVTNIDTSTLKLAGLDVRIKGNSNPQCSVEDVSGDFTNPAGAPDGYDDLVCHFVDDPSAWETDNGTATLTGELHDGTGIEGTDSICIVP